MNEPDVNHPAGPAPREEEVALSPGWLTAALGRRHPGAVVTAVEVVERIKTVATKTRFHLTYAEPRPELPVDLCLKGFFWDEWQSRPGLTTEPVFYRDVGPTLGIAVPPCEYAGVDEGSGLGVVVMRDLKVAGAAFGDPRDTYSPDQSAAVLDELARLHAETWGREATSFPREHRPRLSSLTEVVGPDLLSELLADGRAENIPGAVADGHRLHAAMHAMAAFDTPRCLVHGDLHLGNIYTFPGGAPGLIDWQVVQHGAWALDVAYHVGTALEPDVRAAAERGLVDHYLDRLAAHGGGVLDRDEAWRAYRCHLPYGLFMWGITRFTPRTSILHFVDRLGRAVTDHGSLDLLGV